MAKIPNILFFFLFLLFIPTVSSEYWDFLTIGQGDGRYCQLTGCILESLTVQNLSVIGAFVNISVINYNVTGVLDVSGNITTDGLCIGGSCIDSFDVINISLWNSTNGDIFNANSGNVGIGTSIPSKKMEILTDTDSDGLLIKGSTFPSLYLQDTGNELWRLFAGAGGYGWQVDGETVMHFLENGNVGIGTSSPNEKLTVVGGVNITGSVNITGDTYIGGNTKIGGNLEVENITSPYINKSYITFFSDGSVGITLDPTDVMQK